MQKMFLKKILFFILVFLNFSICNVISMDMKFDISDRLNKLVQDDLLKVSLVQDILTNEKLFMELKLMVTEDWNSGSYFSYNQEKIMLKIYAFILQSVTKLAFSDFYQHKKLTDYAAAQLNFICKKVMSKFDECKNMLLNDMYKNFSTNTESDLIARKNQASEIDRIDETIKREYLNGFFRIIERLKNKNLKKKERLKNEAEIISEIDAFNKRKEHIKNKKSDQSDTLKILRVANLLKS